MSEPSHLGEAVIGRFRLSTGLSLLGKQQGDGFAEPRFLARRGDGQVIQLSRLLYLVSLAIADGGVAGSGTAGAELIAARVSQELGREVTAANVRFLVATELAPLGVVVAGAPGRDPGPASGQAVSQAIDEAPTAPLQAIAKVPPPSPLVPAPSPQALQPSPPAPPTGPLAPQANRRRRPRRAVALGALAAVVVAAVVSLALVTANRSRPPAASAASAAANRARAAAWVAQQVSPGTVVSCDAATCDQLRRDGFPAARLMALGPAFRDPLGSGVVIGTPAVRDEFGTRLAAVYAPLVLAGFGSGANRVEVRAIAPAGVAALAAAVSTQQASARSAGQQLLRNRTVQASPAARAALLAGRVDARLLANLSVLSSQWPITLVAFDDAPPGASPAVPLRGVQLRATSAAGRSAILAFLRAQRGTYRPAVAAATSDGSGQPVVTARFDAPDPMLTLVPAPGPASAP